MVWSRSKFNTCVVIGFDTAAGQRLQNVGSRAKPHGKCPSLAGRRVWLGRWILCSLGLCQAACQFRLWHFDAGLHLRQFPSWLAGDKNLSTPVVPPKTAIQTLW